MWGRRVHHKTVANKKASQKMIVRLLALAWLISINMNNRDWFHHCICFWGIYSSSLHLSFLLSCAPLLCSRQKKLGSWTEAAKLKSFCNHLWRSPLVKHETTAKCFLLSFPTFDICLYTSISWEEVKVGKGKWGSSAQQALQRIKKNCELILKQIRPY